MTSAPDLSNLPAPEALTVQDYEQALAELLTTLRSKSLDYDNLLESDPAYAITEVMAYFDLVLTQRYNDKVKSLFLAFAEKGDLDHIAATYYHLARPVIVPANPTGNPPTEAVLMGDDEFRALCQLAPEGYSVAGPKGAYQFLALKAEPTLKGVGVSRPFPGRVLVSLLNRQGNGVATALQISAVNAALNDETIRPLNDEVVVQSATITSYVFSATLFIPEGPSPDLLLGQANEAAVTLTQRLHQVGKGVPLSALTSAVHVSGVERVQVNSPSADIPKQETVAPFCTQINLTWEAAE